MSETAPVPATQPSAPPVGPRRRNLRYPSLPAVLVDVNQLAAGKFTTTGEWTFPQILQHLARSMNLAFDCADFKVNWIIRTVARLFYKKRILEERMEPGFKLPRSASSLLPTENPTLEAGLAEFRRAIGRFERETPEAESVIFGPMTPEEWTKLQIRHCELHLSYVWPK